MRAIFTGETNSKIRPHGGLPQNSEAAKCSVID